MKNLNNIMNLNRHYVLLLLMVILMIPSQDLSAKKKETSERTDRPRVKGGSVVSYG